jgi:hypothetical protein
MWGLKYFVIFRCECWTLKKPKAVPKKLKIVFHAPDLRGMWQVFKGEDSRRKSMNMDSCGFKEYIV